MAQKGYLPSTIVEHSGVLHSSTTESMIVAHRTCRSEDLTASTAVASLLAWFETAFRFAMVCFVISSCLSPLQ